MRTKRLISALSVLLVLLAVTRLLLEEKVAGRMDTTFFVLIASAFLLHVIPFDRLKTVKAAGVELSLMELPHVQDVITGLEIKERVQLDAIALEKKDQMQNVAFGPESPGPKGERLQDESLRQKLSNLKGEIEAIRTSRVLWIDDHMSKVLGERRLLRSLGVEVVPAASSERARQILDTDNDFDLIVTDVQRRGDSHKQTGGIEIHEGVNFIVLLRTEHPDPVVKSMPVMFYAAYDWGRLIKFTGPARKTLPVPEVSNTATDLITKVIKQLADARSSPIMYSGAKTPTPVG